MNESQKVFFNIVDGLRKMSLQDILIFKEEWIKKMDVYNFEPGSRRLCLDTLEVVIKEKGGTVV